MEEHEQQRELDALAGEAVSISIAVGFERRVARIVVQVAAQLAQAVEMVIRTGQSSSRRPHGVAGRASRRPWCRHEPNHAGVADLGALETA